MSLKYPLNETLSPIDREGRNRLNDNWTRIMAYFDHVQLQIKALAGGHEVDELIARLEQAIANAETDLQNYITQVDSTVQEAIDANNTATQDAIAKNNTALQIALNTIGDVLTEVSGAIQATETATNNAVEAKDQALQAAADAQTTISQMQVIISNFKARGEWNATTDYFKNNLAGLNGKTYIALQNNTNKPVTDTSFWMLFADRGAKGEKGEKGDPGTGIKVLGHFNDASELPLNPILGDAYTIGADRVLYVYNGNDWQDLGSIKGVEGKSAYEVAVENGFVGTEIEWLESLKGGVGPPGPEGPQGLPGKDADLTEVNQEIANIKQTVTDNKTEVTEHLAQDVLSEDGAHGIRFFNDQLAVKDEQEQWNVVELGGTGEVYQENTVVSATGNALGKATWAENADYFAHVGYVDLSTNLLLVFSSVGLNVGDTVKLYDGNSASIIDAEVLTIGTPNILGNAQVTVNPAEPLSKGVVFAFKSGGTGANQVALGYASAAVGDSSFAAGKGSVAKGVSSIAIGNGSRAYHSNAIAIGSSAVALGNSSMALMNAIATGGSAFALGTGETEASGVGSFAIGGSSKASGNRSYAIGNEVIASGVNSHAQNVKTTANTYASTAIGSNGKPLTGLADRFSATADVFVIGGADFYGTAANAFRVTFDGKAYGKAAYNSTGADYAEYFEWLDGNVNDEDRVGFVVALDGDKIRKATSDDSYILGIISSNPSVIGDSYQDDWQGRYITDEWGRIQYHWVENYYPTGLFDEEGKEKMELRKSYVAVENPDFVEQENYIPREDRKEWDAVGLMGKLLVRDDGTCEVNSYAKVGAEEGTLTASNERTDMRVIERVAPNIVRVFIK